MKRILSLILTVVLIALMIVLPAGSLAAGKSAPSFKKLTAGRDYISVSWKSVKGINGYEVRWGRTGTPGWNTLCTSSTEMRITGLNSGVKYTFQVRAWYKSKSKTKYTSWSSKAYATTTSPSVPVPDIIAYANDDGSVTVQWDKCCDAAEYEVNWGRKGLIYGWPYSVKTTASSVRVTTGLETGITYAFRVRTYYWLNGEKKCTSWSDTKYASVYRKEEQQDEPEEPQQPQEPDNGNQQEQQPSETWGPWSDWSKTRRTVTANMQEEIQYHWWAAKCKSCGTHNPYWGSSTKCKHCGRTLPRANMQDINVYTSDKPAFVTLLGRSDGRIYNGLYYWFCEPQYRYRYRQ